MNSKLPQNPFVFSYLVVFAGIAALALYFHSMSYQEAEDMLHEDGLVEQLSAVGYVVCLLATLWLGKLAFVREHFPLAAFPLVFSMRELDFDKRFTETGLLQSRIFTSPDVALVERLAGVAVVLALVVLIFYSVRRYLLPLVRGLLRLDTVAIGVGLAMGLMVISKSLDGLGRKLEPLGIFVTERISFEAMVLEEVLELGIPTVLLVVIVAYFCQRQPVANTQSGDDANNLTPTPSPDSSPGPEWSLIWSDQFDDEIDDSKWPFNLDCWGGGYHEHQCCTSRPDIAFVKDSIFHIVAREEVYPVPLCRTNSRITTQQDPGKRHIRFVCGKD